MKMKMKMAFVAGALALSMAGQASAAIVTGATGASNLILQIYDSVNLTSYTKDLGINISSFLSGVTGTNTALVASSAALSNATYAADALLTSYLSTANTAGLIWNVTANDNTGLLGFKNKQLITTAAVNIKTGAASNQSLSANSQMNTAVGNLDATLAAANTAAGAATSVTAGSADTWIAKIGAMNTSLSFATSGALGSTLNFWYLTPSSTLASAKASVAQFGNTQGSSTWTLASNGTLTYVAPVPEPEEWLLILSGMALIGFIATRRKNEGSMTFA